MCFYCDYSLFSSCLFYVMYLVVVSISVGPAVCLTIIFHGLGWIFQVPVKAVKASCNDI